MDAAEDVTMGGAECGARGACSVRRAVVGAFPPPSRALLLLSRLLSLVALLAAPEAFARRPALRVYSIPDGLKFSQVFCVFQDSRGFLWAGTSYGVSRYDGRSFSTLTKAQGLPHDSVYALAEDDARTVWVSTQAGLARIAPVGGPRGGPALLPLPAAFRDVRVRPGHPLRSTQGALWLVAESGLLRWRGGELRPVALPSGVAATALRLLGPVTADGAFAATDRSVLRIEEGRSADCWDVAAPLGKPVAIDWVDGEVAVLCRGGFGRLGDGTVEPDVRRRLPADLDLDGFVASAGRVFVWSSTQGFVVLSGDGSARRLTAADGLPTDEVNAAFVDRDGLLWAGTEDGLVKVFDLGVLSFPSRRPGLGPLVLSFASGSDGRTWVGHSEGLSRLGVDLASLEPAAGFPAGLAVWGLLPLEDGSVLTATRKGVLLVTPRGATKTFPRLPLAGAERVYGFHRAADGTIWASAQTGALRFRWDAGRKEPVDVETFDEVSGEPLGEARSVASTPDGAVYIGTDGSGVVRWKAGRLTRLAAAAGLPTGVCRSLLARGETVWVGTDIGLFEISGGRARPVVEATRALDDPYVVALAASPDGSTWLASPYRVVRLRSGRVEESLDQTAGLVGASTTAENGLLVDQHGRAFIGMVGGFSVLDPSRAVGRGPAPQVAIAWAVDGQGAPVRPGSRLSHRASSLTFGVASTTYVAEERTRFSERLRGFESDWSTPHLAAEQRYTNLPPGGYVLEVRAVSAVGRSSDTPAVLSFSVAPPWWETGPARGAALTAVAGLAWGFAALRTRRLSRRARDLEVRVADRTRALREANGRLEEAQRQIEELLAAPPRAQEDLSTWAGGAARDIARAIGASGIAVYRIVGEEVRPLTRETTEVVTLEAVRAAPEEGKPTGEGLLLPVRGAAGDVLGAVAVRGGARRWDEAERRLVAGFAHQLGGALEIQRMRARLTETEAARSEITRDLERKGVLTVRICPACGACADSKTVRCPADGSALPLPRLLPYRIRDRYRLVRVLGEGGMGTVFLAADDRLGREVAIKVIRPERFDEPSIRLRFEREANAVARIQHPGVIALHDSGELADGSVFLIMERLTGSDLASLIARHGRGAPAQVGSLLVQAAAALSAAHRSGVVHRDVKPENLFVSPSPQGLRVKVVDFGLAKSLGAADGPTRTGIVVGTPAYMAPEQVSGLTVTARTDLYSLAAVGWEALTGRRLVLAASVGEIFSEILAGLPAPPSSLRSGLPAEVDRRILHALAKDPGQRPVDLEEWALSVSALLAQVARAEPGWPETFAAASSAAGTELRTMPFDTDPTLGGGAGARSREP